MKSEPMSQAQSARLASLATDPRLPTDMREWLQSKLGGTVSKHDANRYIVRFKKEVEKRTGAHYVPFEDTGAADREPEEEPPIGPPDDVPEFPASAPPQGELSSALKRGEARGRGEPEAAKGQQRIEGTGSKGYDQGAF